MRIRTVLGLVLVVLFALGAPAAAVPSANVSRVKVEGYAFGFTGECPDELPPSPLVCTEWLVSALREGSADAGSGGLARAQIPWNLLLLRHTLAFPGGDVEPTESDIAFAFVPIADVTFDRQHLTVASVHVRDVELSDGTFADVDAEWTATGELQHYGNDGPSLGDFGLVHHLHERCFTTNSQGHQNFRRASIAGVINGVAFEYHGSSAFLAHNQFLTIEVHPNSCG